jgi:hypothetical protein
MSLEHGHEAAMNENVIATSEEGIRQLEEHPPSADNFELAVSNSLTFKGKPDMVGFGMSLILRKILALRYEPDGFEQKDGFRLYRYKKMQ